MIRRLSILLIPALIAAGLYLINRTTANDRVIISGAPDTLIYAASFDGASDDALNLEWEQYQGRQSAELIDGNLRISVGEPNDGNYSASLYTFIDFDLRVRAHAVEGPDNNGYGVIFRLLDRNNYYLFLVSSDGYYSVQRVLDGEFKEISTWINTTTPNPELNGLTVNTGLDAVNEIRVVARGDQFEFYVNEVRAVLCIPNNPDAVSTYYEFFDTPEDRCVQGQIVDTLTDNSIPYGRLGVVAQSFDLNPEIDRAVVVDFEHLLVFGQ